MKGGAALLSFALLALSSFAGQRLVVPSLPEAVRPMAEVETNVVFSTGSATDKDAFGQVTELAGGPATELDLYKTPNSDQVKGELRIVEIDFLKKL